jgi:hypothetical protein
MFSSILAALIALFVPISNAPNAMQAVHVAPTLSSDKSLTRFEFVDFELGGGAPF